MRRDDARDDGHVIIEKVLEAVEKGGDIVKKTVEVLKEVPHYTWVGIYMIDGDELVLRYYLGRPTEHIRIKIGCGICGAAVVDEHTIIVPDVNADERYISCSRETRSEIVVPIWSEDRIIGEIDIDSDGIDAFDSWDTKLLERIAQILGNVL
jgi:GAF domain-containing protein